MNGHDRRSASASQSTGAQSASSVPKPIPKVAVLNGPKGASKPSKGQKKRARKAKRKRFGYLPATKPAAVAVQEGTSDPTMEKETLSLPTTAGTAQALQSPTGTCTDTFSYAPPSYSFTFSPNKKGE
jgi:hypothetical protein